MCAGWNEHPRLHLLGQRGRFAYSRKMAAGAQARYAQLGCPGAGVPIPIGIAVARPLVAGALWAKTGPGQTRRPPSRSDARSGSRPSRVKYLHRGLYRSGRSPPSSRRSSVGTSVCEPRRNPDPTGPHQRLPHTRVAAKARGPVGFAPWRPQFRHAMARNPGRRWLCISTTRAASARLTCQAGLVS